MCVTGAFCFASLALLVTHAQVLGQSQPAPTVRGSSLAGVAAGLELERPAAGLDNGKIVISDANLEILAAGGQLTSGQTAAWVGVRGGGSRPETKDRQRAECQRKWRERHRRQLRRVRALEDKVAALEQRMRSLEDMSFSLGTSSRRSLTLRARLEAARQQRGQLCARLARERAELDRIIREARQEGAQPGWFR